MHDIGCVATVPEHALLAGQNIGGPPHQLMPQNIRPTFGNPQPVCQIPQALDIVDHHALPCSLREPCFKGR